MKYQETIKTTLVTCYISTATKLQNHWSIPSSSTRTIPTKVILWHESRILFFFFERKKLVPCPLAKRNTPICSHLSPNFSESPVKVTAWESFISCDSTGYSKLTVHFDKGLYNCEVSKRLPKHTKMPCVHWGLYTGLILPNYIKNGRQLLRLLTPFTLPR